MSNLLSEQGCRGCRDFASFRRWIYDTIPEMLHRKLIKPIDRTVHSVSHGRPHHIPVYFSFIFPNTRRLETFRNIVAVPSECAAPQFTCVFQHSPILTHTNSHTLCFAGASRNVSNLWLFRRSFFTSYFSVPLSNTTHYNYIILRF